MPLCPHPLQLVLLHTRILLTLRIGLQLQCRWPVIIHKIIIFSNIYLVSLLCFMLDHREDHRSKRLIYTFHQLTVSRSVVMSNMDHHTILFGSRREGEREVLSEALCPPAFTAYALCNQVCRRWHVNLPVI